MLETAVQELRGTFGRILNGQLLATEQAADHAEAARKQIREEAESQRASIRDEAVRVADELAAQNAKLLQLSQVINALQAGLTKWAAAGSLGGAVVLFIAVRALGF